MDGGIRSGEDILVAIAAGADFTLLGRPFAFSVAARGIERGPAEVTALLSDELDRALAHLGFASIDALRKGREGVFLPSFPTDCGE
jgi:(S)-mandelate dehydrogenase